MSHHAGVGAKTPSTLSERLQIQKVTAERNCLVIVLKKSEKVEFASGNERCGRVSAEGSIRH